jgi:hypothetical protein
MKKENFEKLIQAVTGRPLEIITEDNEIQLQTEYCIAHRNIEGTDNYVRFYWKTPKKQDNIMRSFITAFASKYTQPNPAKYGPNDWNPDRKTWDQMTGRERTMAYYHHRSYMYTKEQLLKQVEANFGTPQMGTAMMRYGFYLTDYGFGTFVLFGGQHVEKAVMRMREYLKLENIPYRNELSDARWVLRFVLNMGRPIHEKILTKFNATIN